MHSQKMKIKNTMDSIKTKTGWTQHRNRDDTLKHVGSAGPGPEPRPFTLQLPGCWTAC